MFLIFLQLLFSIAFIIFKLSMPYGPPFFLVGMRLIIAGIILLLSQLFLNRKSFGLLKDNWHLILSAAIFNIYITNAFEFWALGCVTAAKASFIYNFSPFVSAFFGYLLLSETMTFKKWLGLIIGIVGMLPILLTDSSYCEVAGNHFGLFSTAELALLIAAGATSYGWISIKQLIHKKNVPIILANGISTLIGGSIALTQSAFVETWPSFNNAYLWFYIFAAVIVSQLLAYNFYASLLLKYSATFMTFTGFSMPFFTALLGWLFLGETVSSAFYISNLIVFIGLCVFYTEEKGTASKV
ncbi:MAG: DMT family transporter [Candidatus Babeliales bacterium]|nr:DMT family transporter [Candidatus Babeliales bacterium]